VPRQSRAQATVDAILEASRRLLVKEGYAAVTTNHVAVLAGTSIGTLYQYFPSIDSIVTSLYQRLKEEVCTSVGATVATQSSAPLPEVAEALANAVRGVYQDGAAIHHILCALAPDIGAMRKVKEIDRQSVELLTDFLTSRHVNTPATLAFALFCALDSVCHDALARAPEALADEALQDALVRQAQALLV